VQDKETFGGAKLAGEYDQQRAGVLWILLGAVSFVLLIACANAPPAINRGAARQKEMAIRMRWVAVVGVCFVKLLTKRGPWR